eukprot:gene19283-biopygen10018
MYAPQRPGLGGTHTEWHWVAKTTCTTVRSLTELAALMRVSMAGWHRFRCGIGQSAGKMAADTGCPHRVAGCALPLSRAGPRRSAGVHGAGAFGASVGRPRAGGWRREGPFFHKFRRGTLISPASR